jgi:hypothetical protein
MRTFCLVIAVLMTGAAGHFAFPQEANTRRIDFKNFSIPWDDETATSPPDSESPWHWLKRIPEPRISLVNGLHHFYKPSQSQFERDHAPLLRMVSVTYGDLDASGAGQTAVHFNYTEGGTANWDYLYVYKVDSSHAELMAILKGGSRAYGGLNRIAIQNGLLVLDFADPDRRVGDCCSEGYIRVRYRWRDGKFVEEGPREHGDVDLRNR